MFRLKLIANLVVLVTILPFGFKAIFTEIYIVAFFPLGIATCANGHLNHFFGEVEAGYKSPH